MSRSGYDRLLSSIRAARAAIRQGQVLAGAGRTALVAGVAVVLLFALDNLFRLPDPVRVALLLAAALATTVVFVRSVIRPATRPIPDDAVAVKMEESAGDLENEVINALQLGREGPREGLSGAFVRSVVERGATAATRFPVRKVISIPAVSRSLALGLFALGLVVVYALVLPRYFDNAVRRYNPFEEYVPPVSATTLVVRWRTTSEPEWRDAAEGALVLKGEALTVSAEALGTLPASARILVESGDGEFAPSAMLFDGRGFSFTFSAVDAPFSYRVEAGTASTPVFHVALAERPEVEGLTLTYRYPEYLALPEKVEKDATGEIRAPVGTRVRVLARLTRPVVDAALSFGKAKPRTMSRSGDRAVSAEIQVGEDDTWSILLKSRDGLGNREPVRHRITAVPDEPPLVEVTAPGKDVTVTLPARVPLTVRARDDHGLRRIAVVARRGDGGDYRVLETFECGGENERVVTYAIELAEGDLTAGEVLTYRAEAADLYPFGERLGRSRVFSIRVTSKEKRAEEAERALADLATRLRELLEREQGIHRDTTALREGVVAGRLPLEGLPTRASSLSDTQAVLGADMVKVAGTVPSEVPALAEVRGALLSLSVNEVMVAVRHIQDSRSRDGPAAAARDLGAAEGAEKKIVDRLAELLGRVDALRKAMEENPQGWLDESMDEANPDQALQDLVARLKKFVREQEEVLELSRELEKKDVDDFTDEDEKLLEKLAAQESELAKLLEDLKDDLSKLPDQDFSNSTLKEELIEAYSEVELAADALTRKRIELAVPREQSGLELAESLVENIEKWLPDARDNVKWNMEELDGEYPEVPMADLPDQLEDLMGDLIEDEEDLGDDMEDVTSGWADSLDKGAGWGVSDGPISNMSAQGKTGNTLPNKNEVGGRSGEGRTGRSHGEMVEGTATGKGGRKTPTRLTPDPWEGKAVKDSSKDPLGGATGGGKLAGGAAEGLRGPLPPEVKAELGRLKGNQVAIRQKAEQLDRALKALNYPNEELERSVVLMKEMEEALEEGSVNRFMDRHGVLVKQMKDSRESLVEHARVVRDRSRAVPKEIMREMESVDLSGLPEGYRDLLREYYKILSRGGAK